MINVEVDESDTSYKIERSHDYIPMNVSRGGNQSADSNVKADVYDNAEFFTQMYDNSLYEKKSESVYEAIEFHKARELRENIKKGVDSEKLLKSKRQSCWKMINTKPQVTSK